MTNLTLVRHGQSDWNNKNLFTGWENPGLTKKGVEEAHKTGNLLKEENKTSSSFLYAKLIAAPRKNLDSSTEV